ncbi:MAG: hypothetical protein WDN24_05570 [Sphingomonas sp.]
MRAPLVLCSPQTLAGCTLHSPMPLIETSDRPDAAAPGEYRVFMAMDRKERGKLPRAERVRCSIRLFRAGARRRRQARRASASASIIAAMTPTRRSRSRR